MTQPDYWTNCYDLNWKNLITPAAFSHPAKFSHGLIKRIYDHALQDGLIQPGGVVLDPFGGVGLGALYAMQNGLHWVGVELEPKFVELARENIALWNARYAAHFPNWGTAQILREDSRRLAEVVGVQRSGGAGEIIVSSPPFLESSGGGKELVNGWNNTGGLGGNGLSKEGYAAQAPVEYGSTPGQLGAMKSGIPPAPPLPCTPAIISSPPFAGNTGGRGEASRNGIDAALFDRHSGGMKKGTGDDPANLDHLPMGQPPVAIVSSPPYAESLKPETEEQTKRKQVRIAKSKTLYDGRNLEEPSAGKAALGGGYGITEGQLGAMVVGSPPLCRFRRLR